MQNMTFWDYKKIISSNLQIGSKSPNTKWKIKVFRSFAWHAMIIEFRWSMIIARSCEPLDCAERDWECERAITVDHLNPTTIKCQIFCLTFVPNKWSDSKLNHYYYYLLLMLLLFTLLLFISSVKSSDYWRE